MGIIYSDNKEPYTGPMVPYHKQDATKHYLKHHENYMFLNAVVKNPKDHNEKRQALKELDTCEKKMKHWQNHANYDHKEAMAGVEKHKKMWGSAAAGPIKKV